MFGASGFRSRAMGFRVCGLAFRGMKERVVAFEAGTYRMPAKYLETSTI